MEKVWLTHYPSGQPETIDPDEFASIPEMLSHVCEENAQRDALHNMGKSMSYAELDDQAGRFAAYLQKDIGLKKGDRVALMMPNVMQYAVALYGVLRAGGVVVNVNPLYTARELQHQLKDSGATVIVIVANFCHTLEDVFDKTEIKHIIVTELGDSLGFIKSLLVNFVVKYIKKMVPSYRLPQALSFKEVLTRYSSNACEKVELVSKDLAFLQYTGGTTGVAKGAMLTHRNMLANVAQILGVLRPGLKVEQVVGVTPLPMYHIFSLTANLLSYLRIGGLNVLITNPRDINGFVKELSRRPFHIMMAVNTLFNALLNNVEFKKLDFSALKIAVGGGMAVQRSVAEKWQQVTGVVLIEGYGLTETSPVACVNPTSISEYNGTIGLPVPSAEVSIRDSDDQELGFDAPGELWIRGPQVMRGYWQKPEETKKVLTADGWLKTGDIAAINEQGFVRIVDRMKDMIVVSGFNVFPNEVEEVVASHDAVLEVGCIGIEDEKSGEAVKVFVVLKPNHSVTVEALREYCKQQLTAYKVPRYVEFREDLPKSNVGKILRKDLR